MATDSAQMKALGFLKDWSNYLLVTTVAAIGWVSTKGVTFDPVTLRAWCLAFLVISVVFGIFTLALIPLVAEEVDKKQEQKSIYDVTPEFDLLYVVLRINFIRIKHVCWIQHFAFLVGVLIYAYASRTGA
ncbi:MAG: hypothetical protein HYV04_08945 [Deltaproteobacteria bacterium]|nr:hypothetical protein [Deltaproteobacteria bacterium]